MKLFPILFLIYAASLFGADAANEVIFAQRPANNIGPSVQRNVLPGSGSVAGYDGSLHPTTYAASVFGRTWLNYADAAAGRTGLGLGSLALLNAAPAATLTGNLVVGSFNSGTGATGSTYWAGDLTWKAVSGSGTVTIVSVTTANGISGSVATATTTPAITLTLGAITPGSVAATGTVTGSNLSGTNTGDQTSVTGNAGTATALLNARTINGVSFDGTANVTVPAAAGTLTGSTLAAGVTASSLTSVGTLGTLTVTAPITGSVTGAAGSTSGNAATATALQNARTINGTSFDGTANITVAAAAGTLTGATLASGITASSLLSAAGGSFGTAAFVNTSAFEVPLTFTTGLTRTVNTITVNTTQNITKLSGLTSNGFVKTSAGDGTLGVDTASYVPTSRTVNSHALSADVTVTASDVGLGALTNDAQTKAAIVPNTAPAAGQLLVGNAGGTAYAPVSASGDLTVSSTGAHTLATVNSNVGTFGSTTASATVTLNAKGLATAGSNTTITPAIGSITGLGTGVATAAAVNVGTAGSVVVNGGALGSPSSGTLTNTTTATATQADNSTKPASTAYVDRQMSAPSISAQTASFTFAAGDQYKTTTISNASANTATIPSGTFPSGTYLYLVSIGAGTCTWTAGGGVTLVGRASAYKSAGQYAIMVAWNSATLDTWVISGDVIP